MKYAILGPRKRILRVVETQPLSSSYEQITNEQAEQVETTESPFFLFGGELVSVSVWLRNHRWVDGEWVDYTPPVPSAVTPRQIRLALIDRGIMPEEITTMIQAVEDPILRAKSLAEWEFATSVSRNNPLIAQLGEALEFTQEDVDEIFREASYL